MTAVIGGEAMDKRLRSVLDCRGGHADTAPHVDDEEQRAAELAETAGGDREPEARLEGDHASRAGWPSRIR